MSRIWQINICHEWPCAVCAFIGIKWACVKNCTWAYRIAGKFGSEFNLADWRICERTAKLNSANIPYLVGGVWKLFTTGVRDKCEASFEDGVVQVLYQRAPDIPYESPLSFRQTSQKMNAEDTSALGAASTKNIRQKKKHRLESSPLNMDPQRQSDIFPIFCPAF